MFQVGKCFKHKETEIVSDSGALGVSGHDVAQGCQGSAACSPFQTVLGLSHKRPVLSYCRAGLCLILYGKVRQPLGTEREGPAELPCRAGATQ